MGFRKKFHVQIRRFEHEKYRLKLKMKDKYKKLKSTYLFEFFFRIFRTVKSIWFKF